MRLDVFGLALCLANQKICISKLNDINMDNRSRRTQKNEKQSKAFAKIS